MSRIVEESERIKFLEATVKAMHEFLRNRCLPVLIGPPSSHCAMGSGTCLRVDGRSFVVTCAHVVQEESLSDIWVLYERNGYQERLPVLDLFIPSARDEKTDVCLIEIDSATADQLGRKFVSVEQFGEPPDLQSEQLFYLYGYPAELRTVVPGTFVYGGLSWATSPVPSEEYPETADPELDLAFAYSKTGIYVTEGLGELDLPDPGGLSGASLWSVDHYKADPLLGPHNAKWIGIQRAWVRGKRIAYGNRVRVLEDLLEEAGLRHG